MPVVPNFATLLLNGIAFSVLRPHHSPPPPQKKKFNTFLQVFQVIS